MAVATKSVNRGWLLRRAKEGKLWVKCNYHYTDDYAYDNAVKCGKMDEFKNVYIYRNHDSELKRALDAHYNSGGAYDADRSDALSEERRLWHASEEKICGSRIMLREGDFKYKSGHISGDKKSGSFSIHSNLNYSYEVR